MVSADARALAKKSVDLKNSPPHTPEAGFYELRGRDLGLGLRSTYPLETAERALFLKRTRLKIYILCPPKSSYGS